MGTYRAVKIVRRDDFGRDRPFIREYQGLLKYEPISRCHPNLMQILHVGRHDRYLYYVTELADDAAMAKAGGVVAGVGIQRPGDGESQQEVPVWHCVSAASVGCYVPRTLQEDRERHGRLSVRVCVSLACALASALKHLHEHGLIHRDVKPSNVIFVHGVPKLADVGLVVTVGASHSIVGTEGYLPPEGPGSPQADLYALGKLLYEASTGLNRGEYPRLPPNLAAMPDAAQWLEFNEVLLRACAKDTARRYHEADELLADLALLERGDSVRRLRRLERHQVLLKRVGTAVLTVMLVVSAAWWQSRRAHQVASRHLARLHVSEGTRRMIDGDYATALPWLVGALELEAGDATRERVHRMRRANVLKRCPVPIACFSSPGSKALGADLSPDGSMLATAHEDGWVHLWNTRSGFKLQQLAHGFPAVLCQFAPGRGLVTATLGQQLHLWDLTEPEGPALTLEQAIEMASDCYSLGLNETLGTVYLSKSRYCFARKHELTHSFENLTLSLRLIGRGETLSVHYEVRDSEPGGAVLCRGEFRDSPKRERFQSGKDEPATPLWGRLGLCLENGSTGDKPGQSSQTVWGNVRARHYPSDQMPPPWRVVDDFRGGVLSDWNHLAPVSAGSRCQVQNGCLVLSSSNVPLTQLGWMGVYRRELFDVRPGHTLEIEADLISAVAPHPMVGLTLVRARPDPYTGSGRPVVVQGRWIILSDWDRVIRLWDIEKAQYVSIEQDGNVTPLQLTHPRPLRQGDVSPDGRYLAVAKPLDQEVQSNRFALWELQTGRDITPSLAGEIQVTGVRFSPDSRFLALTHLQGTELFRTADWRLARTLGKGASFGQPLFSSIGYRLAAVREGRETVIWDWDDPRKPAVVFSQESGIRSIAFSPDGRYLALSRDDGTIQMWDVIRRTTFGPPLPGNRASYSRDGTLLVVISGEGGVWIWDLTSMLDDPMTVPLLLAEEREASSPDGTLTAFVEEHGISINTPAGGYSLPLPTQEPLVRIAFLPGGQCLIAESADLLGWVWDLGDRTLLGPPSRVQRDSVLRTHTPPGWTAEAADRLTLSDLAALLGAQRPDGKGGMLPVDYAERVSLLRKLRQARPQDFIVDASQRRRWHHQHAEAAESAMDWEAAVFHWESLMEGSSSPTPPENQGPPESRLAYALQAARFLREAAVNGQPRILPRPPWARPETVDLSSFYNAPLDHPPAIKHASVSFQELAASGQTLGQTVFDPRGIIDLRVAGQVTVPIGRFCSRIHFLNAASQPAPGNREVAGIYRATYADGRETTVTLLNPEHVAPFQADRFHEISPVSRAQTSSDLCSDVVWAGPNPESAKRKELLFLTRTTWRLPVGGIVRSIEMQAGPAGSAPLIFAITVE